MKPALILNETREHCLQIVRDARSTRQDAVSGLRVSVLCTDPKHPVMWWLEGWAYQRGHTFGHEIEIVHDKADLKGGDVLFLISCGQIVRKADRDKYGKTLVIHAADLPRGRGWSPHIWQLVEGADSFVVTLLEAEDKVDSGAIWHQVRLQIPRHYLHDEINRALFKCECVLMDFALEHFHLSPGHPQKDAEATYYRKRTPQDSEIDPGKTLTEQFDLMRVADAERYPAFFRLHGHTYRIRLEKAD